MLKISAWLLVLICLVGRSISQTRRLKLLNVNAIVVHGMAAPRDNLLKRDSDQLLGHVSFNSLLDSGKRQIYILGKQFAKEYKDFLSKIKEPSKVQIRALNSLPAMMSAWVLTLSMLPDEVTLTTPYPTEAAKPQFAGAKEIENNFSTPLPGADPLKRVSFSDFEQTDYLFQLSSKYTCPNFNVRIVIKEINQLSEKFKCDDSYNKAVDYLKFDSSAEFMKEVSVIYKASRVFEFLQAIDSINPDFPLGSTSVDYQNLRKSHEAYLASILSNSDTLNLLNSPIGNLILFSINDSITKESTNPNDGRKFNLYVAHEKFMLGLLNFLGLYKAECAYKPYLENLDPPSSCVEFPKPGASLRIELYKEEVGDGKGGEPYSSYFISILYNGMKVGMGKKEVALNSQDGMIDWDTFKEFIQSKVVSDWEEECGLGGIGKEELSNTNWVILLVVFNLIVFFVLGCAMFCISYVSKKREAQSEDAKQEEENRSSKGKLKENLMSSSSN